MSNAIQDTSTAQRVRPPWSTDFVGAGVAVVCVLVTWFCTAQLANLELTVRLGTEVQQVGGGAVAVTAGVSALFGFSVLRLLERLTRRALEVWTVLVVGATLLSFLGPLSATTVAAAGTLASMHSVVAAVVIASAQASRRRRH